MSDNPSRIQTGDFHPVSFCYSAPTARSIQEVWPEENLQAHEAHQREEREQAGREAAALISNQCRSGNFINPRTL